MNRPLALLTAVLAALLPASGILAQSTGSVSGRVVDETGAVLPYARVTVRLAALGFEKSATTDEAGQFRLELPAGAYEVTAEIDGFSLSRKKVEVGSRPAEVRFTLHPGGFD